MKRAVFNAVGKVMGNENLGKVFYNNQSAYLANKNSSETGCVFPMVIWSEFNMRQTDEHRDHAPQFNIVWLKDTN